ncbi:MAG TPA: hypothetical protein VMT76_06500 [Puia sp.]|nr:hypothetical protein [Puia sp.]
MQQMEEQINRLQNKVLQLIQQYQLLQKENIKLKQELQEGKSIINAQLVQIDQLKQKAEILKLSKTEMDAEEKKIFERRLTQYAKEIDKCISLLNE